MPEGYSYRSYRIPKQSGKGYRQIDAPNIALLELQQRIYHKLLKGMRPHKSANGFVPSRSIVDNALPHVGKAVVINIDLKDFFTNTSKDRVLKYWQYYWNKKAARILTNICCHKGHLPQGAPTSPSLSNLVNQAMDARLDGLVKRMPNGIYTRYADDLTFSFSRYSSKDKWFLGEVKKILKDEGYEIQRGKKIRIQRSHQRQKVTGLVVNEKVNLPRHMRRKIRAMQYHKKQGKLSSANLGKLRGYEALLTMVSKNQNSSASDYSEKKAPRVISSNQEDKTSQYFSSIVSILGKGNEVIGTGFLFSKNEKIYAITCAHVLRDYVEGEIISLEYMVDIDIGNIDAKAVWLKQPKKELKDLNAFEDIAVLEVKQALKLSIFSELSIPENYGKVVDCWCFSFQTPRGIKLKKIDCNFPVKYGFVEIAQNGEYKIEEGASGSPLYSDKSGVVGMVQSKTTNNRTAYLIPSKLILKALDSLV